MEYSYNFQDNISETSFNGTSKNILEWILENRDKEEWAKDPNAYEMANLFLFGAKYANEGKLVDKDTLAQIWEIRSQDFARCNIPENSFIYTICQDAYEAAMQGKRVVNDENSHHALRKMAGIGLYLKQQQRDSGEITYNNPAELMQLLECAGTLKAIHPNLFQRYAFGKNLNVLCNLQLSQELPAEIRDSITSAQEQLAVRREVTQTQGKQPLSKIDLCQRMINDAIKISQFMREKDKQKGGKNKDPNRHVYVSPANNFYYSVYFELSHLRDDFNSGNISKQDFEARFDDICGKSGINFQEMQEVVAQISSIEKSTQALYDSLNDKVLDHFDKVKKGENQNPESPENPAR